MPSLEIMGMGAARAATIPPKRFALMFGGVSTGCDERAPDQLLVPSGTGYGYDVKRALRPLADLGVRDDVSVISGLKLPWQTTGEVPAGGRSIYYHYNTVGPLISGMRGVADVRDGKPRGPTCDQVVASAIRGDTRFPVLAYRVQVASYVGRSEISESDKRGALSWRRTSTGGLEMIVPTVSPRLAYESLFAGFSPAEPAAAEAARRLLRKRNSALDLVREGTSALLGKVGRWDRLRLERHFDEVRALELRLAAVEPPAGACALPPNPGEDPPIGAPIIEYNGAGQPYSTSEGYSNEDLRADVLTDLIAMAFACDLSRVASVLLTEWKCYMNMYRLGGWETDMHSLTHDRNQAGVADAVAWHVKQLARLTKKLRELPEADGSTVLDHSALVLMFEGGFGYDPEGARANSTHSTENMSVLLAGRAGGLRAGQHVRAAGAHPASVLVSAMRGLGVSGGLGEVQSAIAPLHP